MSTKSAHGAPLAELSSFAKGSFSHAGVSHDVYRKGRGPCVLVISELPGMTPLVLGFADRLVARGLSVCLPDLFGSAGHPSSPMVRPHSVLTVDLIDEPGQPTRAALEQVLALFTRKLKPSA